MCFIFTYSSFNNSLGIGIFISSKTPYCKGFIKKPVYKEEPICEVTRVKVVKGEIARVKAPYKESKYFYSITKLRNIS